MDDIRAKRLARLGQPATPSPNNIANNSSNSPTPNQANNSSSSQNIPAPSAQIVSNATNGTTNEIKPNTTAASLPSPKTSAEVLKHWINSEYENILNVTINSENTNPGLKFMQTTFMELVEDNHDPVFSVELVDRVIIELLTEHGVDLPLKYLKDAWVKVQASKRLVLSKDPLRDTKLELLNEFERLTSSYGLVFFQISDMFLNTRYSTALVDIIHHDSDYNDYLLGIIKRADEEGSLLEFLEVFVFHLWKVMGNISMDDPKYVSMLNIYQLLLNEKCVASVFTQISIFKIKNPQEDPIKFELSTVLGTLFRLSPLDSVVAAGNFDRSVPRSASDIKRIGQTLSTEHKVIIDRLFFIVNKIVRGSDQSRKDILEYFATVVDNNHLRRGDYADFKKLSSNAFMTNITLVLIRMCQPFLDQSYSKIDKIDIHYYTRKGAVMKLTDETRMNSTNAEADSYLAENASDQAPNFISDCFFLTLAYLEFGLGGIMSFEGKLRNEIRRLSSTVQNLRAANANPMQRMLLMQLPRFEKELNRMKSIKDALMSFFINMDIQTEIFEFVAGASCFLVRAVDPNHKFPQATISIPLIPDVIGVENADNTEYFREKAPAPFKFYPEYAIEGLILYCTQIARYSNNPLQTSPRSKTFVEFAVTFLRCPELIGNPHLKSKLVEVLSLCVMGLDPSRGGSTMGTILETFDSNELVKENLLYALLDFYVVVEKTGSSTQYYDKFNSRYHISIILEEIWKNPFYKNQLVDQSEKNEEFFIRFAARMLNDLTFLLDESIRQLAEVHSIQNEIEARGRGEEPSMEGSDEELQARLESVEQRAKQELQLTTKSIELFKKFTADVPKTFTKPEIIDRLAGMLDFNLDALAGPKCSELKVREPEKYGFQPKDLLQSIVQIFINLAGQPDFIKSVSQDGRSFKLEVFHRAAAIVAKHFLINPDDLNKFILFAQEAERLRLEAEEEENELGDVPDEFLDPLMYTLMKDPVILPSSRVSIDLATIKSHLLSDSTDPFNRVPLKLEDVIEDVELKQKIAQWKIDAKAKK
ncbi:hypothetical protein WICPIJ_003683 [Wickerhamomyces pijperi]|uniref:RING-type E3 ubiquitin transferase n=1 Tax=Wickerhamomyces pijperi TaxID=599730 RepID=A0A9P8Q7C9_WICPI|nr:hypothetical protein WICPIJ_003683 [Wickerhamomyces pijperi]